MLLVLKSFVRKLGVNFATCNQFHWWTKVKNHVPLVMARLPVIFGMIVIAFLTSSCTSEPALPLESTMMVVNPGDTDLHVLKTGKGPAVIFIHGGPGMSHHYFRPAMDYLASDHELVYYDQRLSGLSAPECDSSKVTLSQWVEDLEAVRQGVNRDSVILISHSWGARIAIRYAEKYPEHVTGLIFMNPVGLNPEFVQQAVVTYQSRITDEDRAKQEAISTSQALINREPDAIKEAFALTFAQNMYDRANLNKLNLYIPDRLILRNQMMGRLYQDPLVSVYNDYNLLGQITSPTLVIHGSYDASPVAASELMVEKLPGGTLSVIQESGHFSFIEQPDAVKKVVFRFLNNL